MKKKKPDNINLPESANIPSELSAALAKSKKGKRIKNIIIICVIVLIAAAVFFLPKKSGSGKNAGPSQYIEHKVERRNIDVSVSGTATVEPADSYNVMALVKGEILNAPFEEGQTLEKGDLLYKIEAKDVENSITQAEIALENANISYSGILDSVSKLSVNSSSDGKISKIYFDPGDSVQAGAVVADIIDSQTMLLKLPFHSSDAKLIKEGQSADITLVQSGETLKGSVSAVSALESAGNGGTVTSEVTIKVSNPGGLSEQTEATAVVGGIACSAVGKFSYNSSKSVYAEVSGEVAQINKNEGDTVRSGDKILTLKSDSLARQLDSAKLSVKNAEMSLKNARDLLDNYEITAPISGTVIEKNFKTGDTIDSTNSASSAMAVIYDMSSLSFKMNIDELDIAKISVGQQVNITADAVEGKTFVGYVENVSINGVTSNGVTSYPVTVRVASSDELLPGMNVSAEITIEQVTDALAIPVSAVTRGNSVMLKDGSADGGSSEAILSLGLSDGDYIEVKEGLSDGDIILIDTTTSSIMEQMMGGSGGSGGGGGGGGRPRG